MSYAPLEIKKLAIRLFGSGAHTQTEISKIVGYSAPAIKIWIARDKRGEPLSAPARGHLPSKLDDNDRQTIRQLLSRQPDITIFRRRKVEIKRLSPYSPDLNPIEMMRSPNKNKLRRAAHQDEFSMRREVSLAHLAITGEMAYNWFKAVGYVH